MLAPRWRKALRDLFEGGTLRIGLAVLAMAAGTFGVGVVLTAYSILSRELARTFDDTRPASAILVADPVRDGLRDSLRSLPGVAEAELRGALYGRIQTGADRWTPLVLYVVRDFRSLRLDRFTPERGAWPPGPDEALLERTALSVARARLGDRVTIRIAGGPARALRIAGTVHAPGLAPAWMDHVVTGFVPWSSVARDEGASAMAYRIAVTGDRRDRHHVLDVARRARPWLDAHGSQVVRLEIPPPGHPHADQMDTFLFLLGAFGALTLGLSSLLVANTVYTLLTRQVRQVGIMKALGATTRQVAALYLGQVCLLAMAALAVGFPLGLAAGRSYAQFAATLLNANLRSLAPPMWVVLAQVGMGLLLPLLMSLGPVVSASRISIHQALQQHLGRRAFGDRRLERWVARVTWLPRPLLLSLRTTARRRARLVLTLSTLAAGGAVFISALDVSAGWDRAITDDFAARRYDVELRLLHLAPVASVEAALAQVPAVTRAEYWVEGVAELPGSSGDAHDGVRLLGPAPATPLLALPRLAGRWIRDQDSAAVVINHALAVRLPGVRVGDPLRLRVGIRDVRWTVAGIVKEIAAPPTVYATSRAIMAVTGAHGDSTRGARIVTGRHDAASQAAAAADIERALRRAGLPAAGVQPRQDQLRALEDHLVIITSALLLAASLVVLVGGLGLTSALALSVVERTREIGILSAIGATPRVLSRLIVFEGVTIGILSFGVAIAGAIPATLALDDVAGQLFIKTPLTFMLSPRALVIGFALVVLIALIGSAYPARRAARMQVQEALAYE